MRRVTMLLAAMAVMVTLFAAAAYAAEIFGTDRNETLYESNRNDKMYGRDGDDDMFATLPIADTPRGFGDVDKLFGQANHDWLDATDEDPRDEPVGGKGTDQCFGDDGDEFDESCEFINGAPNPVSS